MSIAGDCETDGQLRVEGKVAGNVLAAGLELTESGSVQGDVSVHSSAKNGQVFVVGGRVTGRVKATRVEVLKTGVVLGGIEADEATIQGSVEGGLIVRRRLAIAETAVVDGEVRAFRLSMEEGGRVNGTIHMGQKAAIAAVEKKVEEKQESVAA